MSDRIIVINASPRKNGLVAGLLAAAVESTGPDRVQWVHTADMEMRHCTACMRCRPDGPCVLPEDDAHRVGRLIAQADGLIIGTPTHWGNMSSPLKTLFDRIVPVFIGQGPRFPIPRRKGVPAAVITACTAPWPMASLSPYGGGAVRSVTCVLKAGGFRMVGTMIRGGSRSRPGPTEKDRQKAAAIGRRFAS